MFTTAIPEGGTTPDVFFLDMRNVAWDGMAGGDPNGYGMATAWRRPRAMRCGLWTSGDTHCLARHVPHLWKGQAATISPCLQPSLWALSKPRWRRHASRWRSGAGAAGV